MKPFHELQSDLRLAIVRGYHDQALEAAATLIDVLSAQLGIGDAPKVKWEDIEGKPDFCDPAACACKKSSEVSKIDAFYTSSPSLTTSDISVGGPPGSDVGMANAAAAANQLDLFNGANPSAFDHDGDGKPGGSKKKPKTPKE
jgi:hypothetical protein